MAKNFFGTYVSGGLGLRAPVDTWRADAMRAHEAGIGIVRFNSDAWDLIEPKPGVYDWRALDAAINALQTQKIEILYTLPIASMRNSPQPDGMRKKLEIDAHGRRIQITIDVGPTHFPAKDPKALGELSKKIAERYRGRIRYYEIWNEPDHPLFWKGAPDAAEYAALLKTAATSIRAADPHARIVMGGLAFPEKSDWFDAFLAQNTAHYFDIVNIHLYPAFASLDGALKTIRETLAKYNAVKPIWITETSSTGAYFETNDREAEEKNKATYLFKTYVQALCEKDVEKIFWHTLRNPGRDVGLKKDFDFGLMTAEGKSLSAYNTHRALTAILSGYSPQGRLETGNMRLFIYRFVRGKKTIYAGWSTQGDISYPMRAPGFRAKTVDMNGDERELGPANSLAWTVTETPALILLAPK